MYLSVSRSHGLSSLLNLMNSLTERNVNQKKTKEFCLIKNTQSWPQPKIRACINLAQKSGLWDRVLLWCA